MGRVKLGILIVLIATLLAGATGVFAADTVQPHRCAGDALKRGEALLKFHLPDSGHPFGFSKAVERLTPLQNPAAPNQEFDVLQIWGFVYKAKYRLRFLYAGIAESCVLMGQEILEYAKL
jgi:hypothetical protein